MKMNKNSMNKAKVFMEINEHYVGGALVISDFGVSIKMCFYRMSKCHI